MTHVLIRCRQGHHNEGTQEGGAEQQHPTTPPETVCVWKHHGVDYLRLKGFQDHRYHAIRAYRKI